VYRRISDLTVTDNANRPMNAYTVPTTVRDPGPDGAVGTSDDGALFNVFNLNPANLALGTVNFRTNGEGTAEFHNFEITGTKRSTGRWSLQASFAYRWNRDHENNYFGNEVRLLDTPSTPNDLINTTGGRHYFTTWSSKINGTIEVFRGWRVTPALRHQSGQPFGRTFLATLNYGSQRILAEPIGAQRQDNLTVFDFRAERVFRIRGKALAPFLDVYNLGNSDAASNIAWSSGGSYLLPSTIIGPRLLRVGVKYDW
jgi:hypothetical protein